MLKTFYNIQEKTPFRILSYEWVSQIGHIAMLDTYRKLQLLGLTEKHQNILLAPKDKISNYAYLDLWKKHFTFIECEQHIQAIFPYQRIIGDCFNGFLNSAGKAQCWTELGAEAHIQWDNRNGKTLISIPDVFQEEGEKFLGQHGLKKGDWFVGLHIRDEGYHRESAGSMQSHRNAGFQDYMDAIHKIISRGGWVIRLGDPSMPRMPKINRLIDYAHSPKRTRRLDVFFAANSRFFVGTTSGLTNVVISLGTPCLLVNCISNYHQLWNQKVKFILKPIFDSKKNKILHLSEVLKNNFRWKIFNMHRLQQEGFYPQLNNAESITAAVLEMFEDLDSSKNVKKQSPMLL